MISGRVHPASAHLRQVACLSPCAESPSGRLLLGRGDHAAYAAGAAAFGSGGTTDLDIRDHGSDGAVGFWAGFRTAELERDGRQVSMTRRIMETFRFTDGHWKLVHRRASRAG